MQNDSQNGTRRRILDTLPRPCLRRYGPDKMTVMDIARELKMSPRQCLSILPDQVRTLDALIDEWLAHIETFVETLSPEDQPRRPSGSWPEAVVLELHRKRRQKLPGGCRVFTGRLTNA